ncbi:anti-sigma regulatory factor (Ser/Thr protein kinase) [Kitasatospora sp. MAA4]|uniref:ATP-binding protein n=1 Tax=Kitasatospora sp. MAA4 TaxID=3035093 RepID=UPI002473B664|nr:ATP-binding protein [Kitasatospora sp. MAA4]MDH6131225.1 anti-sigma regulatory factor (Ser/Thr protein kinase) [Kitasatospora sp. MAA4]
MTTVLSPGTDDHTTGPAVALLPYEPQSAALARRLVRDTLLEWDLAGLVEDTELVVSEFAANAAKTGCRTRMTVAVALVATTTGPVVRVSVRDGSRALPVVVGSGPGDESGRGLHLVGALTVRWGADLEARGKTVWADIAVGPQ